MGEIYIVIMISGAWDGYTEKCLKAFSNIEKAEVYIIRLEELLKKAKSIYYAGTWYDEDIDEISEPMRWIRQNMVNQISEFKFITLKFE